MDTFKFDHKQGKRDDDDVYAMMFFFWFRFVAFFLVMSF